MSRSAATVQHDNEPGQLRAVIYARYSCSAQNEQSIEGQLKDCHAYAERCGFIVVNEYIDRALTGRSDDRPSFQRMIDNSRAGGFERVIVWKLDRFSRNRYDSAMYKYKLKQNGVIVCSAMENIGEGDEGIILEAVLEATAEYYSRDLSKKVRRGMRDAAADGHSTGSRPPYGYRLEVDPETASHKRPSKKPVPDGERAEFVRWAFSEYAKGARDKEIYTEMQRRGVDTVAGRPVGFGTVGRMLRNPKYKGAARWGEVTYSWPALVDEETWDAVQARRDKNKRAPAAMKAREHYDLCGKAFCGYCGAPLIGSAGTGKGGGVWRYYVCRGRKLEHTGCKKANEKKGFLEWYVVEQTLLYVLDAERLHQIAERVVEKYNESFDDGELVQLERRVAALDRELDKTTELLFAAPNRAAIDRINKHVVELDAQKDELTVELSKLRIANGIRYKVPEVEAWIKQFCGGDACDPDFRRRIIEVFVNSVYVYDDRVVIYYNVKGGKQVNIIESLDESAVESGDGSMCEGSYLPSNGSPKNASAAAGAFFLFFPFALTGSAKRCYIKCMQAAKTRKVCGLCCLRELIGGIGYESMPQLPDSTKRRCSILPQLRYCGGRTPSAQPARAGRHAGAPAPAYVLFRPL